MGRTIYLIWFCHCATKKSPKTWCKREKGNYDFTSQIRWFINLKKKKKKRFVPTTWTFNPYTTILQAWDDHLLLLGININMIECITLSYFHSFLVLMQPNKILFNFPFFYGSKHTYISFIQHVQLSRLIFEQFFYDHNRCYNIY